jgi:hypothetical protein
LVAHRRGKIDCGNAVRCSEFDDPSGLKAAAQHVDQPALAAIDRKKLVAMIFRIADGVRALHAHQFLHGFQRVVGDQPRQLSGGTDVQTIQDIADPSICDRI